MSNLNMSPILQQKDIYVVRSLLLFGLWGSVSKLEKNNLELNSIRDIKESLGEPLEDILASNLRTISISMKFGTKRGSGI